MERNDRNYKVPPVFNETISYESWKNEIEVWRLVTDLSKEKQALAIVLSLSGKAREKARELNIAVINVATGVDLLIQKLDEIFKKEEVDGAYEAYNKFEHFKRDQEKSMINYIIEFDELYAKVKSAL